MKIYAQEIADNISKQVESSGSINFDTKVSLSDSKIRDEIISYASNYKELFEKVCDGKDLAAMQSILVSTGWNGNTDIFTPAQLWAARKSPILKQVNLNHTDKIVGCMINCFAADFDGNVLDDNLEASKIPDEFDLIVDSVLYTRHPNLELREAVAEWLVKIANGEAYVSMECFFNDFDYGVIDSVGEKSIIPRTEETSWITKHMLQFGGDGHITVAGEQYTLGRVIKNPTFSGQGIVENPANKRSVVFSEMAFANAKVVEDNRFSSKSQKVTNKEDDMSGETVSLKEFNELKAKLEEIENQEKVKLSEELEAAKKEMAKKDEEMKDYKKKSKDSEDSSKAELEQAKAELETVKAELETAKADLESKDKELGEIKESVAKAERANKLISIGKTEEESLEIVAEWAGASDEQFESVVKMHQKVAEAEKAAASSNDTDDSDDDSDATASLGEIDEEDDTAPAVSEDPASDEDDIQASASYMSLLIKKQKNK